MSAAMPRASASIIWGFGVHCRHRTHGARPHRARRPLGQRERRGHARPGAMFGEAYAAAGEPLLVDVVADQDCTVLFLNLAKVVGPCSCRCDHHALWPAT
ncbi:MAG: hypothetical protein ACLSDQ_06000 [Adlercreutzia equolifaciens]